MFSTSCVFYGLFITHGRRRGLTKLVVDSHVQFRLGNVDAFQLADGHLETVSKRGVFDDFMYIYIYTYTHILYIYIYVNPQTKKHGLKKIISGNWLVEK